MAHFLKQDYTYSRATSPNSATPFGTICFLSNHHRYQLENCHICWLREQHGPWEGKGTVVGSSWLCWVGCHQPSGEHRMGVVVPLWMGCSKETWRAELKMSFRELAIWVWGQKRVVIKRKAKEACGGGSVVKNTGCLSRGTTYMVGHSYYNCSPRESNALWWSPSASGLHVVICVHI